MSDNPKILLDVEEKLPILDFKKYVKTSCDLIKNSEPRFSIGIYGEWGSGKTTLMKGIEQELKSESITTVWFNAWKYENEAHHATIPLLKTIAYAIEKDNRFKPIAEKIKTATMVMGKEVFSRLASYFSGISIDKIKNEFDTNVHILADFDKDTIYYNGLDKISSEIKKIKNCKIVVFIDDLDRCSPEKTIQVLESLKAFLDIWGFVFVVGLSYNTTAKLISEKYNGRIDGKEYIKKIIQVPLFVQEWNDKDIQEMIKNVSYKLTNYYKTIIQESTITRILTIALEKNPREIKRFLNSFMISNEIYFKNNQQKSKIFLMIYAFKWRWPIFFQLFIHNEEFKRSIHDLLKIDKNKRSEFFSMTSNKNPRLDATHVPKYFEELKKCLVRTNLSRS